MVRLAQHSEIVYERRIYRSEILLWWLQQGSLIRKYQDNTPTEPLGFA